MCCLMPLMKVRRGQNFHSQFFNPTLILKPTLNPQMGLKRNNDWPRCLKLVLIKVQSTVFSSLWRHSFDPHIMNDSVYGAKSGPKILLIWKNKNKIEKLELKIKVLVFHLKNTTMYSNLKITVPFFDSLHKILI